MLFLPNTKGKSLWFVVYSLWFGFAQSSQRSKDAKGISNKKLKIRNKEMELLLFEKFQPFEHFERIEPFEHVIPPKHEGFFLT